MLRCVRKPLAPGELTQLPEATVAPLAFLRVLRGHCRELTILSQISRLYGWRDLWHNDSVNWCSAAA